jgi:hypothetical protein
MIGSRATCLAILMAFSPFAWAAGGSLPKPTPKPASKLPAKATPKPAAKPLRLHGASETLTCRLGTEDRHARIAVVLVGGRTDSFAYYSKWKPRTCSIHLERHRDAYSRWSDNGNTTSVNLERGVFLIEHGKGEYRFVFRGIDRERYCGMDGTINGTLTIRKGSERCELAGIMDEGVPLGQAYASAEPLPAPAPAPTGASGGTALRQVAARVRPALDALHTSSSVVIGD